MELSPIAWWAALQRVKANPRVVKIALRSGALRQPILFNNFTDFFIVGMGQGRVGRFLSPASESFDRRHGSASLKYVHLVE
jgi:hypothetical protein